MENKLWVCEKCEDVFFANKNFLSVRKIDRYPAGNPVSGFKICAISGRPYIRTAGYPGKSISGAPLIPNSNY